MNVLNGCPIESKCSASNFALSDAYEKDFVTSLTSSPNFAKPQNGAFISSCFTHCEGSQGLYNTIKVNNVSMQAAVSAWCAHEAGQAANFVGASQPRSFPKPPAGPGYCQAHLLHCRVTKADGNPQIVE